MYETVSEDDGSIFDVKSFTIKAEEVTLDDGAALKEQSFTIKAEEVTLVDADALACTSIGIFSNDENAVLEKGAVLNVILHSYITRPMFV